MLSSLGWLSNLQAMNNLKILFFLLVLSGGIQASELPVTTGLMLDLDADKGVETEDADKVKAWHNQVADAEADIFVKRDEGRKEEGSGRPTLQKNVAELNGHSSLDFQQQELVNMNEDAFDHLITGSGYTWFAVISADKQKPGKKDVNSFFGNLRNGPDYEGFWGNLMDDNRVWMGTRNGIKFWKKKPPLWDDKMNPQVVSKEPLEAGKYHLIMGRMGAGTETVALDLYVNSTEPVDSKQVPVNPEANPSKMAVGQERDATNHPGHESFCGEIARFLIFDRPLSDEELAEMAKTLKADYGL
jgi:hypothetical protein